MLRYSLYLRCAADSADNTGIAKGWKKTTNQKGHKKNKTSTGAEVLFTPYEKYTHYKCRTIFESAKYFFC